MMTRTGGARDGPRVASTRAVWPSFRAFSLPIRRGSGKLEGVGFRRPIGNFDRLDLRRATEIARAALSRRPPVRYGSKKGELRTGPGILVVPGPALCFHFVAAPSTAVSRL